MQSKKLNPVVIVVSSWLIFAQFALFVACARAAEKADAPAEKPVLIVFEFEAPPRRAGLGRKIAEMFLGHALRRGRFIVLDQAAFEEVLAEAGNVKVTLKTPPAEVSRIIDESFGAQIAIWGRLEYLDADSYQLHVRVLDRRKNVSEPSIDKTYPSTLHGMVITVDQVLDEVTGVKRKAKRDILKDQSWRQRKNLVKNGDLEKGETSPDNWERVDGLCTFWVGDVSPTGKCVMFDTMVEEPQYKAWRKLFDMGAKAKNAPKKIPPKPPYFSTVGGTVGAHLYSDPVPIKQGRAYRIDFDYKARKGETKVFVKGYAPFYRKDGSVEHREVYRRQINLYPKTNGREWEHDARIMHPSQPFIMLTIRSEFDRGKTGDKLRELLARKLVALGVNPMTDLAETKEKLRPYQGIMYYDVSKYHVQQMVENEFDRGVVVWGEIVKEGPKLKLRLRSLDVRKDSPTKDWWHERIIDAGRLAAESDKIAQTILVNARLVTFLRVKLDAYWPAGLFYFDNVCITEEPEEE